MASLRSIYSTITSRRAFHMSLLVCFAVVCSICSTVSVAFAGTASISPVVQLEAPIGNNAASHSPANVLFVTEETGGAVHMEEHTVQDDSIDLFKTEYSAWTLNVPLSYYFMEPVYERYTESLQATETEV